MYWENDNPNSFFLFFFRDYYLIIIPFNYLAHYACNLSVVAIFSFFQQRFKTNEIEQLLKHILYSAVCMQSA